MLPRRMLYIEFRQLRPYPKRFYTCNEINSQKKYRNLAGNDQSDGRATYYSLVFVLETESRHSI